MAIARKYISQGLTRDKALQILGLTKHHYYYKPRKGKRGRQPSAHTLKKEGDVIVSVNEPKLIEVICVIKSYPETDYGYRAITAYLQLQGYIINKKKVYRLMNEYQLLNDKPKKSGKTYVKHRRVAPPEPLSVLEMDIKFQWVIEHERYAFILSIIDCFTRKILYWEAAYSIKHHQVIRAWEQVIVNHLQPNNTKERDITIEVRNDNDSRFYAEKVKQYLLENGLNQVFTHPYTPQENGHIESFHAILGRSLDRKGYFTTLMDLNEHLDHFYRTYNEIRLHGSLDHLPPNLFWELWKKGQIKTMKRKNKSPRHKLTIPRYQLSGNVNPKEHSAHPKGEKRAANLQPTALV